MVSLAEVRTSNSALTSSTVPKTALFVGATSGIGKYTLAELVSLKLPVKCYIVGRKASEPALHPLLEALRRTNPQAELIWVEAEVSLLSEVKRVCELVKENETRLDLLCLTAGYAPFGGRNDTPEGIEVTHALQYYGRMLFTLALLPLLRAAPSPRVLTVLGGSFLSTNLLVDDLDLRKAGNFGGVRSQTHMSIMNTLFLDRLASDPENFGVTFVHNWPGAVDTGNMGRYHTPSWLSPAPVTVLLKPVFWILGTGGREAGERHVYNATSGRFGGMGPRDGGKVEKGTGGEEGRGLFLVGRGCEVVDRGSVLEELRGAQGVVWGRTMEALGPYL
ncbi:short chain dehydrogenase reductase family protein [Colletotrichum kahawae]|uniref:Short chain dehydrogenase reductase family protein n=1 Tax=Colletotrichum kahawae TaxID=34407 RepID=A0AAD9YSE2_COLKA|nr:short chain dehydrogenase reductase family protein [Colletotrichum kahawae]